MCAVRCDIRLDRLPALNPSRLSFLEELVVVKTTGFPVTNSPPVPYYILSVLGLEGTEVACCIAVFFYRWGDGVSPHLLSAVRNYITYL